MGFLIAKTDSGGQSFRCTSFFFCCLYHEFETNKFLNVLGIEASRTEEYPVLCTSEAGNMWAWRRFIVVLKLCLENNFFCCSMIHEQSRLVLQTTLSCTGRYSYLQEVISCRDYLQDMSALEVDADKTVTFVAIKAMERFLTSILCTRCCYHFADLHEKRFRSISVG